jgi:prepilin-type N-terminal cleavage/methylation domain-containing protein
MTMIELMIVIAIVGILAAILIPSIKQAQDRARGQRTAEAERRALPPDGQLNTIELSEVSAAADEQTPDRWSRSLTPFIPLAFVAAIAAIVIAAARRQMSRRA